MYKRRRNLSTWGCEDGWQDKRNVFISCPQASITAGTEPLIQIKYLSSPCSIIKANSVSCSLFASCIYVPVLPAVLWVARFLPLLPIVTYLMKDGKWFWYPQGMPTGCKGSDCCWNICFLTWTKIPFQDYLVPSVSEHKGGLQEQV